jgi:hypothetical protein
MFSKRVMFSKRLSRFALATAFVFAVGGCGGEPTAPVDPGFAGHWTSSQWGEHYIVVEGSTVRIVYVHDDGRVLGTLDGTTVTGWWTEAPSRQPTRDAGDVTFTLTETNGTRTVDGTWRYGAEGTTRQNWDLVWVDATIPPDIATKLADDAGFSAHP